MKNTYKLILGLILIVSFQNQSISQATRTWVSGVGDDANPCSRTAPCKTFAGAISKTAEKGEINVIDAGGFGAVTITKSISIIAEGFTGGILASLVNGIIINTVDATDRVILKGLDFEGVGNGINGIRILNAESVIIENCSINGFATSGISVEPTTNPVKVVVKDTRISTSGVGVNVIPSAAVVAEVNLIGVLIGMNTTGVNSVGTGATLRLSNSNIINNVTGVSSGSGKVVSLGDNVIYGNNTNNPITVGQKL